MRKHNKHITREELQRYLRGRMSNEQMHEFERKTSEDSFLSDAMEGYEDMIPNNLDRDLDNLDFHMQETFLKDAPEVKDTTFPFMKVAAALVLVMFASAIGYFLYQYLPANLFTSDTITMTEDQKEVPAYKNKESDLPEEEIIEDQKQVIEDKSLAIRVTPEEQILDSEIIDDLPTETEEIDAGAGVDVDDDLIISPSLEAPEEVAGMIVLDTEATEEIVIEESTVLAKMSLTNSIQGQVVSASNDQPINNADVGLLNTNQRTKTNERGEFSMETTDSGELLIAIADGYTSNTSRISENESVTIRLRSSEVDNAGRMAQPAALEERNKRRRKKAAEVETTVPSNPIPIPEIPIAEYRQYLAENLEYPIQATQNGIEGKVILEITVDASGTITNIKTLLGLGNGCDQEAYRLIREGPDWQPAITNGIPTDADVQITVEFRLE